MAIVLGACTSQSPAAVNKFKYKEPIKMEINMLLTSPTFLNNQYIPAKYSCDGQDINPPLKIEAVPKRAKSLALIVDDPDAPNGDWVHWLLWNIQPKIKEIKENSVPTGAIQGLTSFGSNKWGGPCPPNGIHHYYFKLYALDSLLDLENMNDKARLEQAMQGHILEISQLVGLYQRN